MLKMIHEYEVGTTFTIDVEAIIRDDSPRYIEHLRGRNGGELGIMLAKNKPWQVFENRDINTDEHISDTHTMKLFVMTEEELKKVVRAHGGEIY